MDARPSKHPSPSLLEQVVPKLRPFQREALEFATKGKLYDRQRAGSTSTGTSTNGQPMTTSSDQTTGRSVASTTNDYSTKLLLADEMGLGKVRTLYFVIMQRFYSIVHSLLTFSRFSFLRLSRRWRSWHTMNKSGHY
jgi:SNF2 family DNA or RNA helicase